MTLPRISRATICPKAYGNAPDQYCHNSKGHFTKPYIQQQPTRIWFVHIVVRLVELLLRLIVIALTTFGTLAYCDSHRYRRSRHRSCSCTCNIRRFSGALAISVLWGSWLRDRSDSCIYNGGATIPFSRPTIHSRSRSRHSRLCGILQLLSVNRND